MVFKTNILMFIQPSPNFVYSCHNPKCPKWLKLITRLRIQVSHLKKHKFKQSCQDKINLLCSCGINVKSTELFLLHCPQFINERYTLLNTTGNINYKLLENNDSILIQTLHFGNTPYSIRFFMLLTKRFDELIF